MISANKDFPFLGFGVGLRHCHFDSILNKEYKEISWVEAITENFLPWEDGKRRRPLNTLEKIRRDLPVALHGVSLSIGSADPVNHSYLKRLRDLATLIDPCWISDHLCWTGVDGENMHDLLPLPYSEEAINHVTEKIMIVQEYLGRRILIENVSSYIQFQNEEMPEWDFLNEVSRRSGCGILLDVNNIYVSAINHGFHPLTYLKAISPQRVGQIHLAGHTNKGDYLIDTHDEEVCNEVWDLYRWVVNNFPPISAMIEWDDEIPEYSVLENEVRKIKRIWETKENAKLHRQLTTEATASV